MPLTESSLKLLLQTELTMLVVVLLIIFTLSTVAIVRMLLPVMRRYANVAEQQAQTLVQLQTIAARLETAVFTGHDEQMLVLNRIERQLSPTRSRGLGLRLFSFLFGLVALLGLANAKRLW
jgi:uncharacterized protein YhdP